MRHFSAHTISSLLRPTLAVLFMLLASLSMVQAQSLVEAIRFGTFEGRTRIVVDMLQDSEVTVRADPSSGALQLLFADTDATVDSIRQGALAGIVERVIFGVTRTGALAIEIRTKRAFAIGRRFILPRDGDRPVRFVIDLDDVGALTRQEVLREDVIAPSDPASGIAETGDTVSLSEPQEPPETPDLRDQPRPGLAETPELAFAPIPVRKPEYRPTDAKALSVDSPAASVDEGRDGPARSALSECRVERPLVVVDPGHGGKDPGAQSSTGVYEKSVNLEVAHLLREVLESDPCLDVMMTRETDEKLRLRQRVQKARERGGDVFISIHADSIGDPTFGGMSVYTFSDQASDAEAARLVRSENASDGETVENFLDYEEDTRAFLFDMLFRDSIKRANQMADVAIEELGKVGPLVPRPKRSAGFVVLTAPDIPSFLIEMGYLSNPSEVVRLQNRENLKRYAEALRKALRRSMEAGFLFDADSQ